MKLFAALLITFFLFSFSGKNPTVAKEWSIPTQDFNPYMELGMTKGVDTITVAEFVITKQVTLGEYNKYLEAVKRDCTEAYYRKQLPDSSMCTPSAYKKYMSPGTYDAYPASGITWIGAVNYCKWKSRQDQLPDSMEYRLPFLEDWLAAYRYLRTQNIPHDFNRNYSDWLLNVYDESTYSFYYDMEFSYAYPDKEEDVPVLRRKMFIGDSFHHQHDHLTGEYGYSFRGYAYVSFRMIKVKKDRGSVKLHSKKRLKKK